jgi:hypothetical protein
MLIRSGLTTTALFRTYDDGPVPYVEWTPIIAGAIAASALSFVLFTFGSALGIALASSSPSWRDASIALAVLSGLYVILVTIASFGFGGYLAGRLRSRSTSSASFQREPASQVQMPRLASPTSLKDRPPRSRGSSSTRCEEERYHRRGACTRSGFVYACATTCGLSDYSAGSRRT